MMLIFGQIPLSEIREAFELQAEGLIKGTADALLIETSQDILEVKLAVEASHIAMEKTGKKVTLISNVTLESIWKDASWNKCSICIYHSF